MSTLGRADCAAASPAVLLLLLLVGTWWSPGASAGPAAAATNLTQLERANFLIGIAAVGAQREGNRSVCGKELDVLLKAAGARDHWTLKVLDSFGGAPRTFGWGNYFWFAAQDLCEDLNVPYRISLAQRQRAEFWFNASSPMALRFSVLYLNFSAPHFVDLRLPFEQYVHLGLCLPRSCSLAALQRYAAEYFQRGTFELQRDFQLQLRQVAAAKQPEFSWLFFKQRGSLLFIATLLLVISFITLAEVLHASKARLRQQQQLHSKQQQQQKVADCVSEAALACDLERCSVAEELLDCFRLTANWPRAMRLDRAEASSLSVMAGLRTVVCLWVSTFHVYYYSLYAMTNAPLIFAKLEALVLQPVMQACFYVDVFFVISAFLLVYNFLSQEQLLQRIRRNGCVANGRLYLRLLLKRYLRLTPVMLVTLLLGDVVYDFLNMYSPFLLGEHSGIYCKRNWWYNLLYVHNLLDMRNICCSWTWYLACEMQFFVLFTALLFLYARHARAGQIAYACLALLAVLTGWLCNYSEGITFHVDSVHGTLDSLYVKPWVRITPYIGGAALGWLLHRHTSHQQQQQQQESQQQQQQQPASPQQVSWSPLWRVGFWCLCALLYAFTNVMSYWRATPSWLVASFMSLGKLLFALCLGGAIYECARGRGGALQALLASAPFRFASKFCYSVYMLAPVVVMAVFGLRTEATTFDEVSSGMDFIGIIVLAGAGAALMYLLVELPLQRVAHVLLTRRQAVAGKAPPPSLPSPSTPTAGSHAAA